MINFAKERVCIGTEIKLNLNIEPVGAFTMDSYDWVAEVFCNSQKSLIINKSEAIKVDESNYTLLIDTNKVGIGVLKCKVTAQIPDADFPDMTRTEVNTINTGIEITR